MSTSKFYNWVFHYNTFTDTWTGFHRDDQQAYWNKTKPIHQMYHARDIKSLLSIMEQLLPKQD